MSPFTQLSTTAAGILLILVALGVIGLGEVFLALREMTLTLRARQPDTYSKSRYDYGGLHVVGWANVALGLLGIVFGAFLLFWPMFH